MTTWNPADKDADVTLSGGDLTASISSPSGTKVGSVRGTDFKASGKHYFEILYTTTPASAAAVGVCTGSYTLTNQGLGLVAGNTSFSGNGFIAQDGSLGTITTGLVNGDYVGVAVDIGNGLCYFSINGTFVDGSDPVGGSGGFTLPAGNMYPAWGSSEGSHTTTQTANFAGSFHTTPPAGYSAWEAAAAGQPFRKRMGGVAWVHGGYRYGSGVKIR